MKIDVEGAEMLVLKGAAKLLQHGAIKYILLELNLAGLSYGYKNSDVIKYLKSFRYRLPKLPDNLDGKIINVHARSPQ